MTTPRAAYVHEDKSGVTIAVAILLKVQGQSLAPEEVERWIKEIDAAIVPIVGGDADSPVAITIRLTERSGRRIAENLILDAAVDCPRHFERSQVEEPTRTVAHHCKARGSIAN